METTAQKEMVGKIAEEVSKHGFPTTAEHLTPHSADTPVQATPELLKIGAEMIGDVGRVALGGSTEKQAENSSPLRQIRERVGKFALLRGRSNGSNPS